MKAINLIPPEQQRGGGGSAGRSGGGAFIVLAVLAAALIMLTAWTLVGNDVTSAQNDAQAAQQQVQAERAQAQALAPYTKFAALRQARVQTVTQLATSRFDWGASMGELARVIPGDVWLTSIAGTTAPGVEVEGGASSGASLRESMAVPALELSGCTTGQGRVSHFMARLRLMNDVQRVSLQHSGKVDGAGAADAQTETDHRDDPCAKRGRPEFTLVVFYDAPVTAPGQTGTAGPSSAKPPATTAPGTTTSTTTTPASTTSSGGTK